MWKIKKNDEVLIQYAPDDKEMHYVDGEMAIQFVTWLAQQGSVFKFSSILKPVYLPTSDEQDIYNLAAHFLRTRGIRNTEYEGDTDTSSLTPPPRKNVIY